LKFLYYVIDQLEFDVYPYRIPIIVLSFTFIVSAIVGYFAFIKWTNRNICS